MSLNLEEANQIEPDITFREEDSRLEALYRGMVIGEVNEDTSYGYVFVPFGSFESPIDLSGCCGEDAQELVHAIDMEVSGYRDLLDRRVEEGWLTAV